MVAANEDTTSITSENTSKNFRLVVITVAMMNTDDDESLMYEGRA